MVLTRRVGRFFLIFGLIVLAVFVISDLVDAPRFNIFFLGFFSLVAGIILLRRTRTPPGPSARFRWIRSLRQRGGGPPGEELGENE